MITLKINSLFKILYILFGFLIIIYIIYVRLILIRAPRSLIISNPINYTLIILISSWIIISLYIIVKNILVILGVKKSNNKLQYILLQYYTIFENSLKEVYQLLINNINNSYNIISYLAKLFYKYFGHITEGFFLYISYLSRLIILSTFLIDVFYFFQLQYFYRTLILLCIPLSINIFIYILKDFSSNLEDARSYLNISEESINEPIIKCTPSSGNEDIDLTYHIEEFILCSKLNGYFEVYDFLASYYNTRVNIFIYSLYFTGWLYVLCVNFLD